MFAMETGDEPGDQGKPAGDESSEAHRILGDLRALRYAVIQAWQERAVILTRDEQLRLKAEITETCDLLAELTSNK